MAQKGFLEKLKETVFGPQRPQATARNVTASALERSVLALLDPKATPADAKKLRGIVRWLERCPSGLHDLELIVEKRIGISFDMRDAGSGGYRRATNAIILSRMRTDAGTVATLVHEATHAREHFAGYGSNFDVQGREEYARSVVREETMTYSHEAMVCRELVHLTRKLKLEVWKQFLTEHPVQMWFQLVHGVPYQRRPSEQVLAADERMPLATWEANFRMVLPYWTRYVGAYYAWELVRWDMAHGRRPWLPPDEMAEMLGTSFANLPPNVRTPKRGGR